MSDDTDDLVAYTCAVLRLPIAEDQFKKLMTIGHHGVMFKDIECGTPGTIIGVVADNREPTVGVVMHVRKGDPRAKRTFFVLPAHHDFTAPAGDTYTPIGACLTGVGTMLVIYEVFRDRSAEGN